MKDRYYFMATEIPGWAKAEAKKSRVESVYRLFLPFAFFETSGRRIENKPKKFLFCGKLFYGTKVHVRDKTAKDKLQELIEIANGRFYTKIQLLPANDVLDEVYENA